MHRPAGEWKEKGVMPFARLHDFDQQFVFARQRRPAALHVEQGPQCLHFGLGKVALCGKCDQRADFLRQFAGQRHATAGPARHRAAGSIADPHQCLHVAHRDQFKYAAGEQETVARLQATDEGFLDLAEPAASQRSRAGRRGVMTAALSTAFSTFRPAYVDRRIGRDGADLHAVAAGDVDARHAVAAVGVALHLAVIRIGSERGAAAADEIHCPVPGAVIQCAVGMGGADFRLQRVGVETAGQRQRHQVLHQHVDRRLRAVARFDASGRDRAARSGRIDQFQAMTGHAGGVRCAARRVARAAGALHQPRDALRRTQLQHAFHRQEVHAQI
ncbi:hypothetical protein BSY238_3614 [Methyloversatilis sp. RAC08]|nr:hypothetical protein BSY238_3614 [Methyloversatilis sp. RAC08]